MKYATLFNRNKTPQSMPIPGSGQVQNSAGGYTWELDGWAQLDRFLILGSEGGTYYVNESKLTLAAAKNVIARIEEDGVKVVDRIVGISHAGRAPKNDAAIFALALVASFGKDRAKAAAFAALPKVCRTGTHLFAFAEAVNGLRGWGRGLRSAIGRWYTEKDAAQLEYQLVKYAQREGWSHRDLLRLAHPKAPTETHQALLGYAVGKPSEGLPLVDAVARLGSLTGREAAALIREARVPREAVPTELLTDPDVWEALLESMPMTAMIRNLATMTRVGLLAPGSAGTKRVIDELGDFERLKKARVHPIAILLAHATYASGRGLRGKGTWTPVPRIVDALDGAFDKAFALIEPSGKRFLLGVDVSGSMGMGMVGGTPLTPAQGAAAMAMATLRSEEACTVMGFAQNFRDLGLSPKMRLVDVLATTQHQTFGGTDCALPMIWAEKKKMPVDLFVVYTDNETWFGDVHPAQALRSYRQKMGIPAKLAVVGMVANKFTIADPKDGGMLDIVGFDATVPQVLSQFVAG